MIEAQFIGDDGCVDKPGTYYEEQPLDVGQITAHGRAAAVCSREDGQWKADIYPGREIVSSQLPVGAKLLGAMVTDVEVTDARVDRARRLRPDAVFPIIRLWFADHGLEIAQSATRLRGGMYEHGSLGFVYGVKPASRRA